MAFKDFFDENESVASMRKLLSFVIAVSSMAIAAYSIATGTFTETVALFCLSGISLSLGERVYNFWRNNGKKIQNGGDGGMRTPSE